MISVYDLYQKSSLSMVLIVRERKRLKKKQLKLTEEPRRKLEAWDRLELDLFRMNQRKCHDVKLRVRHVQGSAQESGSCF
jgi:hypothetical protein